VFNLTVATTIASTVLDGCQDVCQIPARSNSSLVWHGGVTAAVIVTDDFDDHTTKFSPDVAISRKKTL